MAGKDWMDEALGEMKAGGRPGVAIVVPDDDRMLGELSDQLEALFGNGKDGSGVFLCCSAAHAKERFGERADGAALLFLDAEGRALGSVGGRLSEVLQPDKFRRACRKHLGKATAAAPRLPYGVRWDEEQHHKLFGTAYDPCPPCGMPHFDGESSRMVRYLRLLDQG